MWEIVVIGVYIHRCCLNMNVWWDFCLFWVGISTTGCSGVCCFGMMLSGMVSFCFGFGSRMY